MTSIIDRRAVLFRISAEKERIGRAYAHPDKNTKIWYNKTDAPRLTTVVKEHADQHDGKALLPYTFAIAPKTMMSAARLVIWVADDTYIIGDIHECGTDYIAGMDDGDGYTTPEDLRYDRAPRWVKIDNVQLGHGFPADEWTVSRSYTYRKATENVPLSERVKDSNFHSTGIVITHI